VGKPEVNRLLGRPRHRWVDNIKMDVREIGWGGMDWIDLVQDGDQWRAWAFRFHKMLGNSWVAAQLEASQGGLISVELYVLRCSVWYSQEYIWWMLGDFFRGYLRRSLSVGCVVCMNRKPISRQARPLTLTSYPHRVYSYVRQTRTACDTKHRILSLRQVNDWV
jgi:hypothetical protein